MNLILSQKQLKPVLQKELGSFGNGGDPTPGFANQSLSFCQ